MALPGDAFVNLRARTTLAILGPVLLCTGIFGTFAYVQVRESVLAAAVGELEAIADLRVRQVARLMSTYRSVTAAGAQALESRFAPDGSVTPEVTAYLQDLLHLEEAISAAHVFDSTGLVLASTLPDFVGTVGNERMGPYGMPESDIDTPRVRPFVFDEANPGRTAVLMPIVRDGRFLGTLGVRFQAAPLLIAIETGTFGDTGELLLATSDDDGNARFLTNVKQRAGAMGEILATAEDVDVPMIRALNGENAAHVDDMRDYAGNEVIAVTRFIPGVEWGLVAGVDLAEALAPATRLREVLILLAAALGTLSIIAGYYLGGRLGRASTLVGRELEARNRAERRFVHMLATSPTPVVAVHPSEGHTITLANRQAQRLLGMEEGALSGRALVELVHPEDRDLLLEHLHSAGRGGEGRTTRVDIRAHGADQDSYVDLEVALTPLEDESGPLMIVSLLDLTDRKEAERALEERAQALARSNRELDRFAYVASHDLRAPLRGIDQLAGFIEEDAGHVLPEESKDDLALLRGRVNRLDQLLAGLLEYARVGRTESEPNEVDVAELMAEIVDLYVPEDRIRVEVEDPLPRVFAPRTAVALCLRNLVMNSVKHHDRAEGVIRVSGTTRGRQVGIIVEDDGPGIPAAYAAKAFELFQTLRPRDELEGSGLGLPIVKKAAEAHGGRVRLVVTEGRGARFELWWPRPGRRSSPRDAA